MLQTLGGAFIDDFGLGLKQITISGTTGLAQRLVAEPAPNEAGGKKIVATDGYDAFKRLRDDIYRQYFDLDKKSVVGSADMAGAADRGSQTGVGGTPLVNPGAVGNPFQLVGQLLPGIQNALPTGALFNLQAYDVEVRRSESPEERKHRLQIEARMLLFGGIVLVIILLFSMAIVWRPPQTCNQVQETAFGLLASITTGVFGFFAGRGIKV